MRLIAPTAFKGTRTPLEAAHFLARPGDRLLPLSDGGDGFLECLHHALGGAWRSVEAADPFGRRRAVPVLELPDGTVALECARIVGLAGLDRLDPRTARSLGLAEALAQVIKAPRLWIGLGGSATVDGGLGWPPFDLSHATAFCDVRTDLADAAERFGPQKGARPEDIPELQARLLDQGLPTGPRTGAAGGLGARLLFLGATLVDGGEALLDELDFEGRCSACSAVVTGEGRLDATTLEGKLPLVVARRAKRLGLPVQGRFGSRGPGWEAAAAAFDEVAFEVT
ncbi:MAG TPA: glycerate kinase [Holophaga sp.]|nr:glycerate kinase [Holophaga sp.]